MSGSSQLAFRFIPEVLDGGEVMGLSRPLNFSQTLLLYFVDGGVVKLKWKIPKLLPRNLTQVKYRWIFP